MTQLCVCGFEVYVCVCSRQHSPMRSMQITSPIYYPCFSAINTCCQTHTDTHTHTLRQSNSAFHTLLSSFIILSPPSLHLAHLTFCVCLVIRSTCPPSFHSSMFSSLLLLLHSFFLTPILPLLSSYLLSSDFVFLSHIIFSPLFTLDFFSFLLVSSSHLFFSPYFLSSPHFCFLFSPPAFPLYFSCFLSSCSLTSPLSSSSQLVSSSSLFGLIFSFFCFLLLSPLPSSPLPVDLAIHGY